MLGRTKDSNQLDSISKHIVIDINIALRGCNAFILWKKYRQGISMALTKEQIKEFEEGEAEADAETDNFYNLKEVADNLAKTGGKQLYRDDNKQFPFMLLPTMNEVQCFDSL